MFTIEDIPEEFVEDDEKIQFIKKEINKKYNLLNKKAKTVTEFKIKIGERFNTLKQVVKKNGKKWKKHIEKNFPYMNIRTVQRWMKLANAIDIEKYPNLSFAGHTRLLVLTSLAKRKNMEVHAFLKDSGIALNFKTKKRAEVGKFRDKIDALIKKHRQKPKKKLTINVIVNRLLKTAEEWSELEDTDDYKEVTKSINRDSLDKSIEEIEEFLDQLKEIRNQYSGIRRKGKKAA